MKKPEKARTLTPEQLDAAAGGVYIPGSYQQEAQAFFRDRMGDEMYRKIMGVEAGRRHPYVPAKLFLSRTDWNKYVWIEQNGSLEGFPE